MLVVDVTVEKLDVTNDAVAERTFILPSTPLASLQAKIVNGIPVTFERFFTLEVGAAVRTLVPVAYHFIDVPVIGVLLETRFGCEGDGTILTSVLGVGAFAVRYHGVFVHVV